MEMSHSLQRKTELLVSEQCRNAHLEAQLQMIERERELEVREFNIQRHMDELDLERRSTGDGGGDNNQPDEQLRKREEDPGEEQHYFELRGLTELPPVVKAPDVASPAAPAGHAGPDEGTTAWLIILAQTDVPTLRP